MSWAKYLSVILASMVKFIGGPIAGLALGLTWWETALCTLVGMMSSVVVFMWVGQGIGIAWQKFRKRKPQLFSRRTRLAVRVWQRMGMVGIALLTPLLFTPIGGTLLATSFKVHRSTLFTQMLIWGSFWSVILTLLLYQVPSLAK
ncbi:MAG: hypothetical protein ACK4GN_06175 [Runella sp.]